MQFFTRALPLGALLALTVAGVTACPADGPGDGGEGEGEGGEGCGSDRDCGGGSVCDKTNDGDDIQAADDEEGVCLKVICLTDDDCPADEKCDTRRGLCIPRNLCDPGDSATVCTTPGDVCLYVDGRPSCAPAPAADECTLSPSPGYVLAGDDLQIEGVGQNAAGELVAQTTFTFTTSGGTINAAGVLTAPAAGGDVTVTGTTVQGGGTCSTVVRVYDAPSVGASRVIVIDSTTRQPLVGVKVAAKVAGIDVDGVTDADGAAEFAAGTAATAVSIFPDDNQWHTILNPPDDVIIYTAPTPTAAAEVDGIKGTFDFSKVHTKGDIRLGLAGTAINANITDLNFNTIIGESVPTVIDIEGLTEDGGQEVALPEGLVIGLGDTDFKGTYSSINDRAGPSVGWALAGQVQLSQIGSIISTVAGDTDNINAGAILAAVLPFFAKFDHAIVTGLDFDPAARVAGDPNFDNKVLTPDTLLALSAEYNMPKLPCAPGGLEGTDCTGDVFKFVNGEESSIVAACPAPLPGGATCDPVSPFATGAVLISGVVVPGVGLVPLGLSAGLDDGSDNNTDDFDGVLEQSGDSAPAPGKVLLDYAPPHDGIEGNLYLTVAIALDINSITSTNDLGASIITQVSRKLPTAGNTFSDNTFLQSQGGTYNATTGAFTMTKKGAADFYRVNLDDNADAEWNVWFGGDEAGFTVSDLPVHSGVGAAEVTERSQHADVQAFGLGTGYDGPSPASFDDLMAFDGQDLDNLLYYLGAWSSESCKAGGICDSE